MFLGVDIGTSSVKATLVDEAGLPVEVAQAELPISRPAPLWSEQNPSDWWTATNMAVAKLDVDRRHAVRAIGLSGQMHGATLLDSAMKPLRPAILWNDGRSFQECADLQETTPEFVSIGGNLVMPGFTAPKLEWVRRHEPDVFAKVEKVLLPKDYVRLRMTGELASDMSDSSGTLWMDVENRRWSSRLLDATGLEEKHMPLLYEGHEATGVLRAEAAEAWGMSRVPVVAGGGDNAAGAVGVGVTDEGDALLSLGTSGVIFVAGKTFRSNPESAAHAFCHALPARWHLMSVMLSAASCVDWALRVTGTADAAELIHRAERDAGLKTQEIFLPYLSGERTPHNNPHASGVLFGLTHDSGPAQIGQAVLEGVAFGMADGLEALVASGVNVHQISVIGGGSQSLYWGRILSAALNRPMVYRDGAATGPAYGAARLARYHILGGTVDDMFAPPKVLDIIEPRESDIEVLAPKYEKFTSLYHTIKKAFKGD
ncbi:MAG: xylulokinase [Hyphomonas sp.]|uniref:xylulokinase n=1 Tax=Hyphomonas sp. TaxID=87 RepID=UPI0035278299